MRTSCLTIIRERYCKNREDDIITMKVSDFHFELPPELIAQHPAAQRDHSRLMVLGRESGEISHEMFYDIKRHLRAGDCLVLNNTRVIPARLYGVKEDTGGAIEFVLLRRLHDDVWEVILKPGKRAKPGARFVFGEGALKFWKSASKGTGLSNFFTRVFLKRYWIGSVICLCPRILRKSCRIESGTKPCIPKWKVLRRHPRQGCILLMSCWRRSAKWAWKLSL